MVIPNIIFRFGANNFNFIRVGLGQVRLGYVMLILMLFAPQMNIIFAISTSNNPIINKVMHERGGVPQLDIYQRISVALQVHMGVILGNAKQNI